MPQVRIERGAGMMVRVDSKLDFLRRALCQPGLGHPRERLRIEDEYVRANVRVAAQALQLSLIRLVPAWDGLGYEIHATPAARMLVEGHLREAAISIDSGFTVTRISGPEPCGPLAARIRPGSGLQLSGLTAQTHAAELLRGIATGYLEVRGEAVRLREIPLQERHLRLGTGLGRRSHTALVVRSSAWGH